MARARMQQTAAAFALAIGQQVGATCSVLDNVDEFTDERHGLSA